MHRDNIKLQKAVQESTKTKKLTKKASIVSTLFIVNTEPGFFGIGDDIFFVEAIQAPAVARNSLTARSRIGEGVGTLLLTSDDRHDPPEVTTTRKDFSRT